MSLYSTSQTDEDPSYGFSDNFVAAMDLNTNMLKSTSLNWDSAKPSVNLSNMLTPANFEHSGFKIIQSPIFSYPILSPFALNGF
jgi:hypothetical protein